MTDESEGRRPSDQGKSPVDQWFELFVYAPLGFALDARRLLPRFIDRGRSQVVLARVVGRYAVEKGSHRAGAYLDQSQHQVGAVLAAFGLLPEDAEPPADPADLAEFEAGEPVFESPQTEASIIPLDDHRRGNLDQSLLADVEPGEVPRHEPEPDARDEEHLEPVGGAGGYEPVHAEPEAAGAAAAVDLPTVGSLAIPDYDNLSASQVVPRLGGLTPGELEDVRRYEAAQRGRKTILNKIAQLRSA